MSVLTYLPGNTSKNEQAEILSPDPLERPDSADRFGQPHSPSGSDQGQGSRGLAKMEPGSTPPCLKVNFHFCRGCAGWEAMTKAAADGPWRGALIHCSCSGRTARGLGDSGPQ